MTVLRTAYVNVMPKTDQFDPELKKRLRRIDASQEGQRVGSSFGSGLKSSLGSLGGVAAAALAGVGAAAATATGGAVVFGLKTAASLEQAQIGFETLLGSGIKAKGFLDNLKQFAASTPFELPGLIESSRTLLGVGLDAKQIVPTLRAFGDAAGAVGVGQENFQRIMLATSQAISAGKFQTEDLNQIMENGIPIWTILSRAMGKPVPELRKMASEGKLLSKDVLPLLQKQMGKDYGGAMARQSQTLAGVWSTLKDTVALGLADAIKPLVPMLRDLLPKGAALAGKALKQLSGGIAGLIGGFTDGDVTSDGFTGAMERVGIKAREVFDFFRSQVIPRLRETVGWLVQNRDLIIGLAAALAVVKLGLFANNIIKVVTVVRAWIIAQGGLNAVLLANPIGITIAVLAALVAGIIIAYKRSETFRNVVQAAWAGIQTAVSYAWNNIIKPAFTAIVGFVQTKLIPTVLWLWNNVMKPAWSGISFAIKAAWVVIQVVFAAFKLYLEKVLFPVIRFLWNNVVGPVFRGIAATIKFVWEKGIRPVFQALGGFISKHVAPAFSAGVGAIAAAWNRIKEAAAAPVRFVVETVLNKGIIGSINWLASKVGVKDRIPEIRWGGASGSISRGANVSRNKQLPGDGYGQGDGIGDLLRGPANWLSKRMGLGRLIGKFGNNPFVRTLMGAGNRAKDFALHRVQSLIGELLGGGGSVGAGGLRSGIAGALGALRAEFGRVPLISGLRPGARTLSGNRSYHSLGRAIDIAPVQAWAAFLNHTFGPRLKELITPWQQYNLLNGRPHRYTGAVWNQHNFAGGNAHIHAAMDNGGFLRPGWNAPIYNGTGRPEPVTPPNTMDAVVALLERLIGAVDRVAPGVGAEINGMGSTLRMKGRAR